jgi:hypothetical protein
MKKINISAGMAMSLFWGGVVVILILLKIFVFNS